MSEKTQEDTPDEGTLRQTIAAMSRREVVGALMKFASLAWSEMALVRSLDIDTLKEALFQIRFNGFVLRDHITTDENTQRPRLPSAEEMWALWEGEDAEGAAEEVVEEADYEEVEEEAEPEEEPEEEEEIVEESGAEEVIVAAPARDFDPSLRVSTGEVSDQLAGIEKRILAAVTTPRAVHASLTEDDMALISREVGKARKDIKTLSAKLDEVTKTLHGELVSIHEVVTKNMEAQAATQQLLISMRDALAQQAITIQLLKEGKLDKQDFEDAMEAVFAEPAPEPLPGRPKIQTLTKEQSVITSGDKRKALQYLRSVDRAELNDLAEFFGVKDIEDMEDSVVAFKIIAKTHD